MRDIRDHEKKYRKAKEQSLKKDHSEPLHINKPMPKFQKNIWHEKMLQENEKKMEEERIKKYQGKIQMEKRMKYGELVKNIFSQKKGAQDR